MRKLGAAIALGVGLCAADPDGGLPLIVAATALGAAPSRPSAHRRVTAEPPLASHAH